jgi:transposase-like protein
VGVLDRLPGPDELQLDPARACAQAVEEELAAVLGVELYERSEARRGQRNGVKTRTLTGPTGPLELTVPRARLFTRGGSQEWTSKLLPRYQRRVREVNESVLAAYLSGANTRRIAGAMRPLLKAAPLSKSAVSRVIGTLRGELATWEKRSLAELDVAFLYLDAIALRVRMDRRVTSVPVLVALAVLAGGEKQLVAMEMCGSESHEAWKGFLDGLVERGLRAPVLCIVDGNAGLRRALSTTWSKTPVQRCAVHKLRNLERKAPKHAVSEMKLDFHQIVYAESEAAARRAHADFVSKWKGRCPGVAKSLAEAGDELFTMYRFPKQHWKNIRTTNVIERLNGEFRRRVKTQGPLPGEDAAMILLFGLIATGQIKLRKIDGYRKLAGVLSEQMRRAA